MPFLFLLIGAVFVVSAFRNTQGDLASALEQDLPGFFKWALALAGVGALGWVPGMREISRLLMGLVILVLVLRNYQALFSAFKGLGSSAGSQPVAATVTPAAAYQTISTGGSPTTAEVQGSGAAGGTMTAAATQSVPVTLASYTGFDPSTFLTAFQAGLGFGGVV